MTAHHVQQELAHRKGMWESLLTQGGPTDVVPSTLRALGVYGGAQGVWVDKARTGKLTADGNGVTVGLLHTGSHYVDDLSDDGVLYHYPQTRRPDVRDAGEIEATKNVQRLGLPVFVIAYANYGHRNVHLGKVIDWDDEAMLFLVTFEDTFPDIEATPKTASDTDDDKPFVAFEKKKPKQREVLVRQGQQRFRFYVLKRYGPKCALCDLDVGEMIQAAHIIPSEENGSDDPRNGLALCANHRLAFDAGLVAIEPETLAIRYDPSGPGASKLQITFQDLGHLHKKPHPEALSWHYQRWEEDRLGRRQQSD